MEQKQNQNINQDENIVQEEEMNFLYDRLIHYLEYHAFLPLDFYNASNLRKCDKEKLIFNEDMNSIKRNFNDLKEHYINQVRSEIKNFVEKFDLRNKLQHKSEVMLYDKILTDCGLTLEDLRKMDELHELGQDENNANNQNSENNEKSNSLMQYYVDQYTQEKNKVLESENQKLREELKLLREKNNLKFN
jgi:hypothetical protein